MLEARKRNTAIGIAVLIAGVAVLTLGTPLVPRVRAHLVHVFGPQYWELKYYYWTYQEFDPRDAGDGGLPTQILLQDPMGIDVDGAGNVYVAGESTDNAIRPDDT